MQLCNSGHENIFAETKSSAIFFVALSLSWIAQSVRQLLRAQSAGKTVVWRRFRLHSDVGGSDKMDHFLNSKQAFDKLALEMGGDSVDLNAALKRLEDADDPAYATIVANVDFFTNQCRAETAPTWKTWDLSSWAIVYDGELHGPFKSIDDAIDDMRGKVRMRLSVLAWCVKPTLFGGMLV